MTHQRQQAEAFEAALHGAAADPAVRDLVRHAEALCAHAAEVGPTPDFRENLRERLMTEAPSALAVREPAVAPRRPAAVTTAPVRRRIARLSAAAIVAAGGVALVASSAQAVPGDLLYDVKRGVEQVELVLHRSDETRGDYRLAQAQERLAEAEHLAEERKFDLSADALADFREQAGAGAENLFTAYESGDGSAASVESVNSFAARTSDALVALAEQFPSGSLDPVEASLETVRSIASQARVLCTECEEVLLTELVQRAADADPLVAGSPASASDDATATAPAPTAAPGQHQQVAPDPAAAPAPKTPAPQPAPAPTAQVPVVTPLVEGLLGEEGLVPSLLGGLLGR